MHTPDHCLTKSLFHASPPARDRAVEKGKLKSQLATEQTKAELQKNLVRNTWAAIDPFLTQHESRPPRPMRGIRVQKRKANEQPDLQAKREAGTGLEGSADRDSGPMKLKSRAKGNLDLDYSSE